jgi:two-component system, NtrC family, sensor histidine kinase HydH
VITTLALGAAAIGSAWLSWRATRSAGDELVRAQAQVFRDAVLSTNRVEPERRAAVLDSIVNNHKEGGLRFAAWVRASGEILVSGGTPDARPLGGFDTTRVQVTRLGVRVRASFPPPAPPSRLRAFESMRVGEGLGPPSIIVEFEPVLAESMAARALGTLVVAGIVALVLMGAGIAFWRISQRMEEQRRLTALGEMSAVMAHEIRNPLASLKGHAQLLVERLPAGAERRKAERVVDEATRLESLTSDLLDFARSGPIDVRPVDPVALTRSAVREVLGEQASVNAPNAPDRWPLDERRFRQAVLVNLLRNAAQAVPATRPPETTVVRENGNLVFSIRDFGPGLPPEQEEHIFDAFFTTRTTGTGLGLAVARRIVELHGGRIDAGNVPGGGARFRVVLPWRRSSS